MNDDPKPSSAGTLITIALIFGLAYAVLRYHLAGPVPWKDFPFFILNKGISLSAFVLLTCNFGLGPLKNLGPCGDSPVGRLPGSYRAPTLA